MKLEDCNPFIRAAEIQPAIMEGNGPRKAYDHRLFYILAGTGAIIIQDVSYSLAPQMLILLPPAMEYYFSGKMRTVVLNFDLTRRACHRKEAICPPPVADFDPTALFDANTVPSPYTPYIAQGDPIIQNSLIRLVEEFNAAEDHADALTSALPKALLAELFRDRSHTESSLCKRLLSYIRIHAPQISSNEQIGEIFGYHPVYLGEVFRRITGKTIHAAVMDARISLACRLLNQSDMPISDIAEASGFCSRTHFCTVFKRVTGSTPSAYRHNLQ